MTKDKEITTSASKNKVSKYKTLHHRFYFVKNICIWASESFCLNFLCYSYIETIFKIKENNIVIKYVFFSFQLMDINSSATYNTILNLPINEHYLDISRPL